MDNEGNNDEEEDEEDELEEAYFWHDQIIAELRRACRDDDPRKAYAIIDTLSVDRLGRTSYTARAERTGEVVVVKANVLEAPVEKFTGQRLITELFLMRDMLPHPNVVGFYDLYIVQTAEVWLITEYMKDGVTLGEIIANTASKFTEEQIARVCVEVRADFFSFLIFFKKKPYFIHRRAKGSRICTTSSSSTAISAPTP